MDFLAGSDKSNGGSVMKIVVEVVTENNGQYLFGPTGQILRGRWANSSPSIRGMTSAAGMLNLPTVPGMHIEVDTQAKRLRVFDPLASDPDLLQQINDITQRGVNQTWIAHPETVMPLDDETNMKSVLYWMHRMTAEGYGKIVSGQLTEQDVRKLPGRIRIDYIGSSPRTRRYEDEPDIAAAAGVSQSPAGGAKAV